MRESGDLCRRRSHVFVAAQAEVTCTSIHKQICTFVRTKKKFKPPGQRKQKDTYVCTSLVSDTKAEGSLLSVSAPPSIVEPSSDNHAHVARCSAAGAGATTFEPCSRVSCLALTLDLCKKRSSLSGASDTQDRSVLSRRKSHRDSQTELKRYASCCCRSMPEDIVRCANYATGTSVDSLRQCSEGKSQATCGLQQKTSSIVGPFSTDIEHVLR